LREDIVDLWDLTKLLFRRWYVAAPMLLLSAAMVILVAITVGPDYSAKGHLQIIPAPSAGKAADPTAKARPTNPWMDLGYEALANAAALAVTDQAVLEDLADRGLTDSVTVTMDDNTVLLEIEAIGRTPTQATATVKEVIRLIEQDVAKKQSQYGVLPEDTISTLTLSDGTTPEVVRSKVMRVLVVAAGIGVLMTVAGTIALDALLRRRARRLEEEPGGGAAVRSRSVGVSSTTKAANGHDSAKATRIPSYTSRPTNASDEQPTGVLPAVPAQAESKHPGIKAVEYKSVNAAAAPQDELPISPGQSKEHSDYPPLGADATIVLPLSHVSWRKDKKP
jgi:capsular polysaccharide biosynthesis protein